MLVFTILIIASVRGRSLEKRSAEADFIQTFKDGSFSQSFDCSGPAGCGGGAQSSPPRRTVNQAFNQGSSNPFNNGFFQSSGSSDPFDNDFFNSFKQQSGKKKRSAKADADPGFVQTFQRGSHSQSFDCTGPNGCPNAGGFEFNTQNIRNQAAQFNQQYNQGSSTTNFSHGKKKRSAKPQFKQTFQDGSYSQGYDCNGPAGCGIMLEDLHSQIEGFEFNTQNIQNHAFATKVNPWYNGRSTGVNIDH